eukprot:4322841-Pyramimonas_sp.AAC.1
MRSPCIRLGRHCAATRDLLLEGPPCGVDQVRACHCRALPARRDVPDNFHGPGKLGHRLPRVIHGVRVHDAHGERALHVRPGGVCHLDHVAPLVEHVLARAGPELVRERRQPPLPAAFRDADLAQPELLWGPPLVDAEPHPELVHFLLALHLAPGEEARLVGLEIAGLAAGELPEDDGLLAAFGVRRHDGAGLLVEGSDHLLR